MNCPAWSNDGDEHACPACFANIEDIVRDASREAQKRIPKRGDIASWHRASFKHIVPLDYYAGGFRQEDAQRICLGFNVGVGGASGFPYRTVLAAMDDLCGFVTERLTQLELAWETLTSTARVQRIAQIVGTAVGRFVHVHPFLNGNGRMSRVLWTVLLARLGLPRQLSVVRRPGGPYGNVMQSAMNGNYAPAVAMVLAALSGGPPPPAALPTPPATP